VHTGSNLAGAKHVVLSSGLCHTMRQNEDYSAIMQPGESYKKQFANIHSILVSMTLLSSSFVVTRGVASSARSVDVLAHLVF
jgi:hypothetical protein